MKTTTPLRWRWLGLSLYALALFALLLLLRFPGEELRVYGEARLAALVPGSVCRLAGLAYRFPVTLEVGSLTWESAAEGNWRLQTRDLVVKAVSLRKPYRLEARAGVLGGSLTATLLLTPGQGLEIVDLRLLDLDLAGLPEPLRSGRQLAGRVDLDGQLTIPATGLAGTVGRGRVDARDGAIALRRPILALEQLRFHQVSCALQLGDAGLTISEGRLQGPDVELDFSGILPGLEAWSDGRVVLRGRLRPQPALLAAHPEQAQALELLASPRDGRIGLVVEGTPLDPTFRLEP